MNQYTKLAISAATSAGEFLQKKITSARILAQKANRFDIVTDADIQTQKLITELIFKEFPLHKILGEESEEHQKLSNEFTWIIDPIDGTGAFSTGLPTYASSIALFKGKKPISAAVFLAINNTVVYAEKGEGSFVNGKKLKVREVVNLNEASVGFDPYYKHREKAFALFGKSLGGKLFMTPMIWSQAAGLALIASGIFDGYIVFGKPKIWDIAAGILLLEEAGGAISDFKGNPLSLSNIGSYVASGKTIHRKLLSSVRNAQPGYYDKITP
ncbi:inositol monophosphatase [Candidatus Gottesmanbacteria bacterium]|nr:inositol monophosphatase [Candidatus Gottesmanbacteria bacterium]